MAVTATKTTTRKETKAVVVQSQATPITILWENILMLPISGTIDSTRAQEIMETILVKITESDSKFIIIDILGVASVDSAVASHIIKITKACKLIGADCIISGISPAIAQTLVHLGLDMGEVITTGTLKGALEMAFDRLGFEVREIKDTSKKRVVKPSLN